MHELRSLKAEKLQCWSNIYIYIYILQKNSDRSCTYAITKTQIPRYSQTPELWKQQNPSKFTKTNTLVDFNLP